MENFNFSQYYAQKIFYYFEPFKIMSWKIPHFPHGNKIDFFAERKSIFVATEI